MRRRVVSLVPSLTEALASVHPELVVGATEWCTHPADLAATRVRGTKNPDLAAIRALAPDVVIANKEENRELDVRRLRESGVEVWVSEIETVPEGIEALETMFDQVLGWDRPDWLAPARDLWTAPVPRPRARVAVPIWRDPWMVVGAATFTDDLLARLGLHNVYADADAPGHRSERYPTTTVEEIESTAAEVVLLPDEPYVFTATDGPEAFSLPTRLVSGRLITWYGPSLVDPELLELAQDPRR